MKKVTGIVVIMALTQAIWGQDSLRLYLSKWETEVSPKHANFFRDFVKQNDSSELFLGLDYYMTGNIKAAGYYLKTNVGYLKTGKFINYYTTGSKKDEGIYVIDTLALASVKVGKWKHYYPDERLMEELFIKSNADFSETEVLVISFWDSTGVQRVTKGNGSYYYTDEVLFDDSLIKQAIFFGSIQDGKFTGKWIARLSNGRLYSEQEYSAGKLHAEKIFGTKGVIFEFDSLNSPPFYEPGKIMLIRFLQDHLVYPQMEKDNDIQGRVIIKFTVDTDGSLNEFKVVEAPSFGLGSEALRVVSQIPRFHPKVVNGKAVKSEHSIPIDFKLR